MSEETVVTGDAEGEGEGLASGFSLETSSEAAGSFVFPVLDPPAGSLPSALVWLAAGDFFGEELPPFDLTPLRDFVPLEVVDFVLLAVDALA